MVNKPGQVLVLVLLVVVVALSIGLSVASRNITNLKTATQSERSQRAFSAAEGGVEDILSRLNLIAGDPGIAAPGGKDFPVPVGDISATVNVKSASSYTSTIDVGFAGQVDLNPSGTTATQVKIDWGKVSDTSEEYTDSNPASIEVIQYFADGALQDRKAFTPFSARSNQSGFVESTVFNSPSCSPSAGFRACVIVDVAPTVGSYRYLRIRPFWVKATVQVTPVSGSIPVQTYTIDSTASTNEGITRKVQVTRNALPSLPAAFDYALFSSGSITK